ncbi:YfdQ family protein [Moraxella bovis]|uniref:YfdQ family protein n=1 Tax=Moraxella bovis TaxID=476 RepID=UPI0022263048|nr:YfdQ family protein [Moraxella bovis]UZA37107.1 YfdQ family protein [Moraxella bovis]
MSNIFENHESDLAVIADLTRPDILKFGDNGIAYNGNIELGNIDRFLDARTRKRGTFSTDDLDSFGEFVEVHGTAANTEIFIDKSAMEAMAVLNFGDDNYPMGHCDFCAALTAKPTKVYEKITDLHHHGRVSQKEFSVFLEDWGGEMVAFDENGVEIPMKKAIGIVRDMKIDELAESTSQVGNFRESRSRLETVAVKSQAGLLPAYFEIKNTLYETLSEPKTVRLRLSINTANGKPEFVLSIVGLELLKDELAGDFLAVVEETLGDDYSLFFGTFSA